MKLQELSEALNPFFNNQSFYKTVKTYFPELKRIIMKFLQSKRVSFLGSSGWGEKEPDVDFNDLSTLDVKKKPEMIRKKMNKIEKGKNFFSVSSGNYDGKIELPDFKYKDYNVEIEIYTNEDFFENGHDLKIRLSDDKNKKEFSEKIDLMQKVDVVLEKIWSALEQKIESFNSVETEKIKTSHKEYVPSLIRKTFEYTIGKVIKRKKGEVSIVDTDDKSPIDFGLVERGGLKYSSSVSSPRNLGFEVTLKVKGFGADAAWVKNKYPELDVEFKRYSASGGTNRTLSNLLGDKKLIGVEHEQSISRFELFCDRVAKMGFFPKEYSTSYKRGDPDVVKFAYGGDKFKEKINSDPVYAKTKIRDKLKESFYDRFEQNFIRVKNFEQYIDKQLSNESANIIENLLSPWREIDYQKLTPALDNYMKLKINEYVSRRLIKKSLEPRER